MKNKKGEIVIIGIIIVLAIVGYFFISSDNTNKEITAEGEGNKIIGDQVQIGQPVPNIDVEETVVIKDEGNEVNNEENLKIFVLTGENFKFIMNGVDNPDIIVNQGDTVRIEFTSTSGFHDWVVDELGAATEKVRPENGVTIVEFVADTLGEFEYYCSVGSHRANGMKGMLIVQ